MLLKKKAAHKLMLIALACLACLGPLSAQTAQPSLAGDYEGTIGSLHLMLHLRQSAGGGLTGTFDSIDQDVFGIRLADITQSGMKFSFTEPGLEASYQGEISPDGNTITGISKQSGSAPLVFTRKPGTETDYAGMLGHEHLMLHLRESAGTGLTGSIESIDDVAFGGRCADITEAGTKLTFTVPELQERIQGNISVQGNYQGEISSDGNTITGTWEETGSAPLVFARRPGTDAASHKNDTKSRNYGRSAWAHFGTNGKLVYRRTSQGDRIPDFSSAGYRGGGVALPQAPTRVTMSPSRKEDDTPALQAAIDKVAALPPGPRGIRGAVVLTPGNFNLAGTLHINVSGVVIRGAGSEGTQASVLKMTGKPHLAIEIKGEYHRETVGPGTALKDQYVPAGSTLIHLADATGIHPGDTLQIVKPVTPQWVHFMGMDHLVRNGEPETWVENDIRVFRKVVSVTGNAVELEVPLTDSFDSRFYGAEQPTVTRVAISGPIEETGIENLRIVGPNRSIDYHQDAHFDGIAMDNIVDSWLRGLAFVDTTNSVSIGHNAERLTVVLVDVQQDDTVTSHAQPFDFSVAGSEILLDRCSAKGDRVTYVATQSHSEGPVVVLHCRFTGSGQIEGHQRWSTGFLVDSSVVPDGRIHLRNRGIMGSGHGWASGWSVLWNNDAEAFLVQNPPGDLNWSIGDVGEHISAPMPVSEDQLVGPPLPGGVVESMGTHVEPNSLYLAQLRERKGSAAVKAIGYHVQ
jgi:hypothetical protein